jgi:hypothetical protein
MQRKKAAKLALSRETLRTLAAATFVPRLASAVQTTCVTLNQCIPTFSEGAALCCN